MAAGRTVRVEFPLAGVDRSLGFQKQPPYTTPDALNVRARDQQDGRRIGATRPGLIKADPTVLGGGSPIRLLNAVNVVPDATALTHRNEFVDSFTDPSASPPEPHQEYGHYFGYGTFFPGLPFFADNITHTGRPGLFVNQGRTGTYGLWLETFEPPILKTEGSSVQFGVRTHPFTTPTVTTPIYCDTIRLYLTTDAVVAAAADGFFFFDRTSLSLPERNARFTGFVITLVRSDHPFLRNRIEDPYDVLQDNLPHHRKREVQGLYQLRIDEVRGGIVTTPRLLTVDGVSGGDLPGQALPQRLTATLVYGVRGLRSEPTLRIEYDGESTAALTVSESVAADINRFGFSMSNNLDMNIPYGYQTYLMESSLSWSSAASTFEKPQNLLIAGSLGRIYARDDDLVMRLRDPLSPVNITTDHNVPSAPWLQKLYISDYDRVTEGSCGLNSSVPFVGGVTIDFDDLNIDANDHVLVLYDTPDPETQSGSYDFTLIGGTITLTNYPRGDPVANGFTVDIPDGEAKYRVERAPKIYDPTRPGVTSATEDDDIQSVSKLHKWVATAGLIPAGCPILVGWLGRAVLAGPSYAPHAWWMSRSMVWTDFDIGLPADDIGRAFADSTFDRGSIGRPITAVVPHTEDYLIFGSAEDSHVFVGDPGRNGYMDFVAPVGFVSHDAWAHDPAGRLLFLSREGLFVMPAGRGQPAMFSKRRMPRELLEIDSANTEVVVAYDARDSVFHIFLKPHSSATASMWTVDLETLAIWPGRLASSDFQPTVAFDYRAFKASDSDLILGCLDGGLRRFQRDGALGLDDGSTFEQYAWVGPLNLSPDGDQEGVVLEVSAILSQGSGAISWTLHVGDSAAAALAADAIDGGTFLAGQNIRARPRAKAMVAFIRLSATAGTAWGLEHLTMRGRPAGRRRP